MQQAECFTSQHLRTVVSIYPSTFFEANIFLSSYFFFKLILYLSPFLPFFL